MKSCLILFLTFFCTHSALAGSLLSAAEKPKPTAEDIRQSQVSTDNLIKHQVKLLEHPDPHKRVQAAFTLNLLNPDPPIVDNREKYALSSLVKHMKQDESEEVREQCARAIIRIGTPRSVKALLEQYPREKNHEVRLGMVTGTMSPKPHATDLYLSGIHDSDQDVQHHSAFYLGWIKKNFGDDGLNSKSKQVKKELLSLAAKTKRNQARTGAIRALKWFPELREQSIPILIDALNSDDNFVRRRSIESLGQLRAKEALPLIITDIKRGHQENQFSHYHMLGHLYLAAAYIKDPTVAPLLNEAVTKPGYMTQRLMAALGQLGDPSSFDVVYEFAQQSPPRGIGGKAAATYMDSLCALGTIGNHKAEKLLKKRLRDRDLDIVSSALVALTYLNVDGLQKYFDKYRKNQKKVYGCWVEGFEPQILPMNELVKQLEKKYKQQNRQG